MKITGTELKETHGMETDGRHAVQYRASSRIMHCEKNSDAVAGAYIGFFMIRWFTVMRRRAWIFSREKKI